MYDVNEKDWKIYKKLMVEWQERYIKKLNKEYINILIEDNSAKDNYWNLRRKIKESNEHALIQFDLRRSTMERTLLMLLINEDITFDDLLGFSVELIEVLSEAYKVYKNNTY